MLKILVNIIRDPKYEKVKYVCLQALKNIIRSSEHEKFLKQIGANDILMLTNISQGTGQQLGKESVN